MSKANFTAQPVKKCPALLVRIRSLDCQNEVRPLRKAIGPLVDGEHALASDTHQGTMTVVPGPRLASAEGIAQAVMRTGMRAESWSDLDEPWPRSAIRRARADRQCMRCGLRPAWPR